jgi:putative phosphoribosyl transferase
MAESQTRTRRFRDRAHAERLLAERLGDYAGRDDVVVLALPRGGAVAYEIASALETPLDVLLVRKLGVPGHEEYALGAIATGGIRVLNTPVVESLNLPADWIEAIDAKERCELQRREQAYRGDRPPPELAGRTVILVDDGLATGATILAALHAVRVDEPARVVASAPVECCSSEPAARRPHARVRASAPRRGLRLRRPGRARDAGALRPHRRGVARHRRVLPRACGDHESG